MTSITLNVTGARIQAVVNGPLTSGMVGIPVTIHYDDAWNGLIKNFVCRCGKWGPAKGETRTVLNIGEAATVAHEVMKADMRLYLGVEGYSANGKLVIPTTWADCGMILHGANAGEDLSTDPKLSIWAQLQAEIEKIKQDPVTEGKIAAAVAAYLEENPIEGSDFAQNVDLTGYATQEWVQKGYQPKGEYLTYGDKTVIAEMAAELVEIPAVTVPTKTSELTNDSDYQTAEQVTAIVNAQLNAIPNAAEVGY